MNLANPSFCSEVSCSVSYKQDPFEQRKCFFGSKRAKSGQNRASSVSREPLVIWTWLTPHFVQMCHVYCSVSYKQDLFEQRKCLFWPKEGQNRVTKGETRAKHLISITVIVHDCTWTCWELYTNYEHVAKTLVHIKTTSITQQSRNQNHIQSHPVQDKFTKLVW